MFNLRCLRIIHDGTANASVTKSDSDALLHSKDHCDRCGGEDAISVVPEDGPEAGMMHSVFSQSRVRRCLADTGAVVLASDEMTRGTDAYLWMLIRRPA